MSIDPRPSSAGPSSPDCCSFAYLWPRLLPASNIAAVIVAGVPVGRMSECPYKECAESTQKIPRWNKTVKVKEKRKSQSSFYIISGSAPPATCTGVSRGAHGRGGGRAATFPRGRRYTRAQHTHTDTHMHKHTHMHTWDDLRWDGTDTKCNMQHAES